MIVVTGTKRSGTSMWMQILQAGGFPVIGEAFPRNWRERIYDANPAGFYESYFRRGINFTTNPHPRTGTYLAPAATRQHAVKVFVPGLVRSDLAYIDHVVATIRPWREYVASLARLHAMEEAARERVTDPAQPQPPAPVYERAELEWWRENYMLLADVVTRGYPFFLVAYDAVIRDAEAILAEVFAWLGSGDVAAAAAATRPDLRTQDKDAATHPQVIAAEAELSTEVTATFDALYDMALARRPLDQAMVDRLNATQEMLEPLLQSDHQRVRNAAAARRRALRAIRKGGTPDAEPAS